MSATPGISHRVAAYVEALFDDRLPSWAAYHDLTHTRDVVEGVEEVGRGMGLTDDQMEIVVLAAWFHDTGYMDGAENHEERSVMLAEEFLNVHGYPATRIAEVIGCIHATKLPQSPHTVLEQVVCDSDILHIGKEDALEKSALLRIELEERTGRKIADADWVQRNIEFLANGTFHTTYAREMFGPTRQRNVEKLRAML